MRRRAVAAVTVGAVAAGLTVVQVLPGGSPPAAAAPGLVPYAGCAPLLQEVRSGLVESATAYGWGGTGRVTDFGVAAGAETSALAAAPTGGDQAAAVGAGPTGTNLQEQGVDEPDLVKLSGGHLLTVSGGALRVVRTGDTPVPVGRLALPARTDPYGGGDTELLVAGDRVLVVERGWGEVVPAGRAATSYPVAGPEQTTLRLADVADPARPRWLESWTVDGGYVSARLTDGTIRLVTRSAPAPRPAELAAPYGPAQERAALAANRRAAAALTVDEVLPHARHRDATGQVLRTGAAVGCEDVSAAPRAAGGGLLLVTTLRPDAGLAPLDSTAVIADGDLVYAAADRLVVATSRWGTTATPLGGSPAGEAATQLHAFDTTDREATRYVASGEVPGYVLGRWALSRHEDALRVATTTGEPWGPGAPTSSSSVVVLREQDGALVESGRVDGLGRGEQIQAVRYLGDLATVVTFRQTDPLYVLDLADPAAPRLTGELEVPGFSTYLHPIGDDRLLGLGMEADPATGVTTGVQASVFDLTDLTRPAQLSRVQLGQGFSEALQESRAFAFDPARGLAVLPFQTDDGVSSGLGLRVAPDGTVSEMGRLAVPRDAWLRRTILDGDRVHAVTDSAVVTGAAGTLTRRGEASLRD